MIASHLVYMFCFQLLLYLVYVHVEMCPWHVGLISVVRLSVCRVEVHMWVSCGWRNEVHMKVLHRFPFQICNVVHNWVSCGYKNRYCITVPYGF